MDSIADWGSGPDYSSRWGLARSEANCRAVELLPGEVAIEARLLIPPECSKDTCSEILPCFGAGIQSKHFGSKAPVAMAEVARALDAGDSRLVPKRLIRIVRLR